MERGAGRTSTRPPLRVLWLIDSLTIGGAEALAVRFAQASRARAIELTVCARSTVGTNELEDEIRRTGIRVENLEARNLTDVAALRRLLRLVESERFDIIHAHLTYAAIWGAIAARLAATPLVASIHVAPGTDSSFKGGIREWIMTRLLRRYASRVVLVSNGLRDLFAQTSRIEAGRLTVIHNGIDAPLFDAPSSPGIRAELNIPNDAPLVVTVAVLREGKGVDVLLHAAAKCAEHDSKIRFLIVGDGSCRITLQTLARELNLGSNVIWGGHRRDVPRVLAESDLFVLPTLADAFPTVLLEALAAGLPVIASDVGGVPEIVDEANGRLVPPGDAEALAKAIANAMSDETWRRSAGAAGRAKFQRLFTTAAWVDRLEDLYDEVIRERRERS